jgi:carbonic anhydrase/acetyltransferase-like protein (isoleucine patch superfamily)
VKNVEKGYIIRAYKGKKPVIPQSCTIFEGCVLMGDIRLGENCTIMPNCVLRADYNPIIIGDGSNIQDLTCIHVDHEEGGAVVIGKNVTIGHRAVIHGCTIKDNSLIGMNSTILSHAVIEENCFIGAASLVTEHAVIPEGSVAFGSPARVKRPVNSDDLQYIKEAAEEYREFAEEYMKERREEI